MLELAVIRFYDEIRNYFKQTMDLDVESETYFRNYYYR